MEEPRPLRWYGGKYGYGKGKWIASILPWEKKTCYVEPFGGMAGVLLARQPVSVEIYNDLNNRVVNWWKSVRDHREEFSEKVEAMPLSRYEYEQAILNLDNPEISNLERALAFHCVVFMSMSSTDAATKGEYRIAYNPSFGSFGRWRSERVAILAERIWNLQIECRDAITLMERIADEEGCVVYADPPYPTADTSPYVYMPDFDKLSDVLLKQKGRVGLSGYGTEWDHLGWIKHERDALFRSMGKNNYEKSLKRVEVLWTNFVPEESQIRLI